MSKESPNPLSPAKISYPDSPSASPYSAVWSNTPESVAKSVKKNVHRATKPGTPGFYIETPEKFNAEQNWQRFKDRFLKSDEQKFEQFKSIEILKLAEFAKKVIENDDAVAADEYQKLENSWKEIVGVILQKNAREVSAENSIEVVGHFPQLEPIFRSLQIAGWAQLRYKQNDGEKALEMSNFLKETKDLDEAILPQRTSLGKAHSDTLSALTTKFNEASRAKGNKQNIPEKALRCLVKNALQEEAMRKVLKNNLGSLQKRIAKLPDVEKQEITKAVGDQYSSKSVHYKVFKEMIYSADISKTVDQFFTLENSAKTQKWFKSINSLASALNAQLKTGKELLKKQKKDLESYSDEVREGWDSLVDKSQSAAAINEIVGRQTEQAKDFLTSLFSSGQFSAANYFSQTATFSPQLDAEIRKGLDEILNVVLGAIDEQENQAKNLLEVQLKIAVQQSRQSKTPLKYLASPAKYQSPASAKATSQSLQKSEEVVLNPQSTKTNYFNAASEALLDNLEISTSENFSAAAALDEALELLDRRGGSSLKKAVRKLQFAGFTLETLTATRPLRDAEHSLVASMPEFLVEGGQAATPLRAPRSTAKATEKARGLDTPKESQFHLSFTPDSTYRECVPTRLFSTPGSKAAKSPHAPHPASEWDESQEQSLETIAEICVREAAQSLNVLKENERAEIIALALGKSSAASLMRQITVKRGDKNYDPKKHFTTDLIETFVPLSQGKVDAGLAKMREGFKNKKGRHDQSGEPSDERFGRFVTQVANDISNLLVVVVQKLKEDGRDLSDAEYVKSAIGEMQNMLQNHEIKTLKEFKEAEGVVPSSSVQKKHEANFFVVGLKDVIKNSKDSDKDRFARPIFTSSTQIRH